MNGERPGPRRLILVITLFLSVTVLATAGYVLVEGWPVFDALYMVIITLFTVGYGEVHELTPTGRAFTIFVIFVGASGVLYTLSTLTEYIVAGHMAGDIGRRRMQNKIKALRDHHIICGFGRVGRQVAHEFAVENVPFVIVDSSPESIAEADRLSYMYVLGDAGTDEALLAAGIMHARGLVSAVNSDAENLYVTLTAHSLRPDLHIVTRATFPEAEEKLKRAGADHVVSPYSLGGRRMASLALHPAVTDFLDQVLHTHDVELWLVDVQIAPGAALAGSTIGQARVRTTTGATVVAIRRMDGGLEHNLDNDTRVEAGDILLAVGSREQLAKLESLATVEVK